MKRTYALAALIIGAAAPPQPSPTPFAPMTFTGIDDLDSYSSEYSLALNTPVTVQFTNQQADASALVSQQAFDGSDWVNLASNMLDANTPSADFVNGYPADKYRFRVGYQRHTTGNPNGAFSVT